MFEKKNYITNFPVRFFVESRIPFFLFFFYQKSYVFLFLQICFNRVKEDKDTIFKRFVQKVFIFCIFREERKIIFPWSVNDERTDSFNGVSGKSIHL